MAESLQTISLVGYSGSPPVPTPLAFYAVFDGTAWVLCSQPFENGAPVSVTNLLTVTDAAAVALLTSLLTGQGISNTDLAAIATSVAAATPAGSNVIGRVGIDQTTPGTTNAVQLTGGLPAGANQIGMVVPIIGATPVPFTATSSDLQLTGLSLPGKIRITYPLYQLGTVVPNAGQVQINYGGGNSVTSPTGVLLPGQIDDWVLIPSTTAPHVSVTSGTGQILIQQ